MPIFGVNELVTYASEDTCIGLYITPVSPRTVISIFYFSVLNVNLCK